MFKECLRLDTVPPLVRDENRNMYVRGLDEFPGQPGWLVDTLLAERDSYLSSFIETLAPGAVRCSYADEWSEGASSGVLAEAADFERDVESLAAPETARTGTRIRSPRTTAARVRRPAADDRRISICVCAYPFPVDIVSRPSLPVGGRLSHPGPRRDGSGFRAGRARRRKEWIMAGEGNWYDLRVYVGNIGRYNEGSLVGGWATLPMGRDDLDAFLRDRVGIEANGTRSTGSTISTCRTGFRPGRANAW